MTPVSECGPCCVLGLTILAGGATLNVVTTQLYCTLPLPHITEHDSPFSSCFYTFVIICNMNNDLGSLAVP